MFKWVENILDGVLRLAGTTPSPDYCPGTGHAPTVVVLYPEGKKMESRVCRGCDRSTVEVIDNVVLAHMKVT